uniref:Uncharacterized protein n=1 Tax=Arundo donax TaxID=35708 RepID=A0A0A9E8V9_ARUDO
MVIVYSKFDLFMP